MKLIVNCEICQKPLELLTEFPLGPEESLKSYKCGHSFIGPVAETPDPAGFETSSLDGMLKAYDYQAEGVEFIRSSGFNCLVADQMGLGKTIQALLALRSDYVAKTPALILVKSATVYQWIKEYKKWCDPLPLGIFMIEGSKNWIPPGFKTYICAMDTFSRIVKKEEKLQELLDFGFKLLIVDEVHSFKNASSSRTQALIQFIKKISHREITRTGKFSCHVCGKQWSEEITITVDVSVDLQRATNYHSTHCPQCGAGIQQVTSKMMLDQREGLERMGLIFLSGTPIKNRAEEYFVPLNLLAPERFPSLDRFRRAYLEQADNGKWNRVSRWRLNEFRDVIKPYVIRRERKDVLTDLPKFTRTFTTVFIDDENLKAAYNAEIDKIAALDSTKEITQADIQDNIFTMRRIIGMAKVKFAANLVKEMIDESEDEKIAIGVHHHSVADALIYELKKDGNKDYHPVNIAAGRNIQYSVDEWKNNPHKRVAVISQLGGGVGLNLQFCHLLVNIERQWNSADEEQLEDRFNRIGQEYPVSAEYLVAKGTIDAWFSNMVEEKRLVCGETVGNNFDPFETKELMKEMATWAMANKL